MLNVLQKVLNFNATFETDWGPSIVEVTYWFDIDADGQWELADYNIVSIDWLAPGMFTTQDSLEGICEMISEFIHRYGTPNGLIDLDDIEDFDVYDVVEDV